MRRRPPWAWGATDPEIDDAHPCSDLVPEPAARMIRAVDVGAPAAHAFRWVAQLTQAPYSYDLVDNLGRRSPRALTPGADALEPGTPFVLISQVVDVVPGREVTAGRLAAPIAWGDLVMMRKQLRTLAACAERTS